MNENQIEINNLLNKIKQLSNDVFINDSGNIQFNTLYINLKEFKILETIYLESKLIYNIHISAYTKNSITVTIILKH